MKTKECKSYGIDGKESYDTGNNLGKTANIARIGIKHRVVEVDLYYIAQLKDNEFDQ